MSITIEDVWRVADEVAPKLEQDPRYVFGDVGLFLERPLKRWTYFCTPRNSVTFGSTGGDGVHFGFLQLPASPHIAPIVMTVPMSDNRNIVVAESLEEFLNLGCHVGWFSLEQLSYSPSKAIQHFSMSDAERSPEEQNLLETLRRALNLRRVPLSSDRLADLRSRYAGLISAKEQPTAED